MSLRLVTNDNKNINVSLEEVLEFKLITDMLDIDIDTLENTTYELSEDYEIPLDISFNILNKIIEFSNYELNNKETHIHNKLVYYNEYFTCEDEILFGIMNSADYLNYDSLLDKSCEKISDDILKCDSVEDVKKKFKITREFTEEEEKEILEYAKM